MDRTELEALDRETLVQRAIAAGIRRARVLTRPEIVDELLRLDPNVDPEKLRRTRGFFGRARDLLARVVERGLHLPDAADRLRAALDPDLPSDVPRPEPQAVPTVTLAEIYAAQGHKARAIETLERVLEREPDHVGARTLLAKLRDVAYVAPEPPLPPEHDEPETVLREDTPDDEAAITREAPTRAIPPIQEPVEGAASQLEDEESPPTLRADECVAVPTDGRTVYVWWRLSTKTQRDLATSGAPFVVRAVIVSPDWEGPAIKMRDTEVDGAKGELVLSDVPEGAVVRVAIGMSSGASFEPIAHSPAFERPRDDSAGVVEWTLAGIVTRSVDAREATSIARAFRASRRVA